MVARVLLVACDPDQDRERDGSAEPSAAQPSAAEPGEPAAGPQVNAGPESARYTLQPVPAGSAGLQALQQTSSTDPVAVVIVAWTLPDMTGAQFLAQARQVAPHAQYVIAARQEELADVAAGRHGELFGVLARPIHPVILASCAASAVRQHDLVALEQDLATTLTATMDVLVETLALASPIAYRRISRMRQMTDKVAQTLGVGQDWRLHVAAILSQIGCFAVPGQVLAKVEETVRLSVLERQMFVGSITLAHQLLTDIPRLAEVAEWVGDQVVDLDSLRPGPAQPLPRACFGAIAGYLAGYDAGLAPGEIAERLVASGRFTAAVVEAVRTAADLLTPKGIPQQVFINQVRPGMILNADVTTTTGLLLVRRGERVTQALNQRLHNFARTVGVAEPLSVLVAGEKRQPRRLPQPRRPEPRTTAASPRTGPR